MNAVPRQNIKGHFPSERKPEQSNRDQSREKYILIDQLYRINQKSCCWKANIINDDFTIFLPSQRFSSSPTPLSTLFL